MVIEKRRQVLPPGGLTVNVLTVIFAPALFQVHSVIFVFRAQTHQNATFFDAFFILFHALFRNVPTDQSTNQAAASRARTSTGYRSCQWTSDD